MAYSARFSLIAIIDGKDMHRNIFAWATANIQKKVLSDKSDKNFTLSETDGTPVKSKLVTFNCKEITNGINITNWGKLVVGKTYTISLYAKADKANQIVHYPFVVSQTTGGWSTQNISTEWVRLHYSFVAKEDSPMIIFYPEMAVNNVQICGIKVEEGDEMTDFCLNEQDNKGDKGDKGDSPYIIHTTADTIIWNQEGKVTLDENGKPQGNPSWPTQEIVAYLEKDGKNVGGSLSYTKVSGNYSVKVQYASNMQAYIFRLDSPEKIDGESELWTNGMLRISYDFGNGSKIDKDIPIALNALGTWKMSVINDTMTAVSKKKVTYYDKDNKPQTDTWETALAQSSESISGAVKENGEILSGIGLTKDGINCFGKQFTWGYTDTNGKNQTVLSIDGKTGNAKFTGDVNAKSFSTTNNTFVVDAKGNITCVSGTFNNIKSDNGTFTNATMTNAIIKGSLSSPWISYTGSENFTKGNNIYVDDLLVSGLRYYDECDGKVIRIINTTGKDVNIPLNHGILCDLDGSASYNLKLRDGEFIEMIGCPTNPVASWKVLDRVTNPNEKTGSQRGMPIRTLAIGKVEFNRLSSGFTFVIFQSTFDGQEITAKRTAEGEYQLTLPSNWSTRAFHVILTPLGTVWHGSGKTDVPAFIYVKSILNNVINIFTGDDNSGNDCSFFFEIKELGASQF